MEAVKCCISTAFLCIGMFLYTAVSFETNFHVNVVYEILIPF